MAGGIEYKDKMVPLKIKAFIADAPARCFMKCIKGHTGYHACKRCTQKGTIVQNRTTCVRSDTDGPVRMRTDHEFNNFMYVDTHQHALTPLLEIDGISCIHNFPLDYMHNTCLGVTRRLLQFIIKGPLACRLSRNHLDQINQRLLALNGSLPSVFARQTRSMNLLHFWKATE